MSQTIEVVTEQTEESTLQLLKTGFYFPDNSLVSSSVQSLGVDSWQEAYKWIYSTVAQRHDFPNMPVWCWVKHSTDAKLPESGGYDPPRITWKMKVPEDLIVYLDWDLWHMCINGGAIDCKDVWDDAFFEEIFTKDEILLSWQQALFCNYQSEYTVQGLLPWVNLDWITNKQELIQITSS
jgi:hypothetical protein